MSYFYNYLVSSGCTAEHASAATAVVVVICTWALVRGFMYLFKR